ncbi:ester cyclase [Brevundimonas sp. 2R-24]|uniref:Ester cyclase n=1 Tax=Peiella sedimenti TaxID=3061083 RepID=A0ABT8SIS0_9CAUL|nr:ester cyclase [Caulobacteraceae bacterium XZ-24]
MTPRELALAVHDIWNTGDLDRIPRVYAEDFLAHWPPSSETPERRGLDGVVYGVKRIRTAFPDWFERVDDVLVDGDRVAVRYTSTGTHQGAFWGLAPTGARIEVREMSIYRVADGRIAEQWCLFDELARLQQLGVGADILADLLNRRPVA